MRNSDDYISEEDNFNSKIEQYLKNNMEIVIHTEDLVGGIQIFVQLILNEKVISEDSTAMFLGYRG